MAAKYTRHAALTEPLARFVDRQIAAGGFALAGEVVRAVLWFMERDKAAGRGLQGRLGHDADEPL